ncbi:MAG: peptidylprolyl isomerase [Clostridia bacterium]|nr:peptidylprolyl isomerase [Clostridia bacterium]
MSKKSLLALLLVAVMALSGCSLVMKDQEVDNLLTIIDVNGTLVNKQVFANTYEYNLYIEQYYASMLASFGGDGTVDTDAVLQSTIDTIITSLVTSQKCAELGFDQLTAEDEAQVQADAQVAYEEELEYVKEYYFANTELSGEELEAAVAEQAAASGVTLEVMVENARATLISDRLRASVTDLVTVTDEDIQAELDALIAEEKTGYENNLAAYGLAVNNSTAAIYYTPAGYRTVKLIETTKPTEEGAEDTAKTEIEALAARLQAGEAFDTLSETVATKVVCEVSTDLDAAIVDAAMRIPAAGEVSPVVETATGYALIQYVEDVAENTVTLDEVRDSLYEGVLTEKQDAAYEEAVAAWIAEADVKIYTENINN